VVEYGDGYTVFCTPSDDDDEEEEDDTE